MGVHEDLYSRGFYRVRQGRLLGGVCTGLGRRFGMDPWVVRLLFFLVLWLLPGSPLLVYPILWVVMPDEHAFTWSGAPRA